MYHEGASMSENLVLRSVYLDPEDDRELRKLAFEKHQSKNELIRRFVKEGMQKEEESRQRHGAHLQGAQARDRN
jgi:hypothetical protein